jgi:hypothetical protein
MKDVDAFNDQLEANGNWIFACGLADPKTAMVIDNRNYANQILAGPLFDVAEQFSGFWVIQADDLETARALAVQGSKACNRKVELRSLL